MTNEQKDKVLQTWLGLQTWLAKAKHESDVVELLAYESLNKKRSSFLLRIHGKLARMRFVRERSSLLKLAND